MTTARAQDRPDEAAAVTPAAMPPGKTSRDENFPVASRLLAPDKRPAVMAFYRFVRTADDIADSPVLAREEKLARLDALEADIAEEGSALGRDLAEADRRHGAGRAQARLMLSAFRQDATRRRYATWADLLDYCTRSADPVGRFLLALHRESERAHASADALCTALQILNHLQDLDRDRATLDRVYLPVPWMERAGGEDRFFDPANADARRPVLDAALDRVDALVDAARALPGRLRSRRLALQSRATLACAEELAAKLRRHDPVSGRVELSRREVAGTLIGAGLRGAVEPRRAAPDVAVTNAIVRRSGSSFRLGMRHLPAERRRAIHAVYAFCRVVDDIADGAAPVAEKQAFLDEWRRTVDGLDGGMASPIARELAWAVPRFELPKAELHAMLDGMETDAADRVRLADAAALDLYARRVAGSVGSLSVRIFGAPEAQAFALSLGRTLQLVNILRDVDEDAAIERVYVPLSHLGVAGHDDHRSAAALLSDPRFGEACAALAHEAEAGFAKADADLDRLDRRTLMPAILMMEGYRRILQRLQARGFAQRGGRVRLGAGDRLTLLRLAVRGA